MTGPAYPNRAAPTRGAGWAEAQLPADLQDRLREFTGRRWVFEQIDSWLSGTGGRFLLTGQPGTGKSLIAARILQISNRDAHEPGLSHLREGATTYAHFCQARHPWTQNPLTFVEAISGRIAGIHDGFRAALMQSEHRQIVVQGKAVAGTVAAGALVAGVNLSVHVNSMSAVLAFDEAVRKPLAKLGSDGIGHPIVILVDGLDEALGIGGGNLVELLAAIIHPNAGLSRSMRFLLTARSDEPRIMDRLGLPDLDLQADAPHEEDDVGGYARSKLRSYPEPARSTLATRVAQKSGGNFLYARHVLENLLKRPEQVEDAATFRLPSDLKEVYYEFISRELAPTRRDEAWRTRYRPVLGLLAVARDEGLTPSQMAGAAEILAGQRIRPPDVLDTLEACAQFLTGSLPEGPVRIYHQSFREFLLTEPALSIDQTSISHALAEYFLDRNRDAWEQCDDDYALLYTPAHLAEAAAGSERPADRAEILQRLGRLVSDYGLIHSKLNRFGVRAVIEDYRLASDDVRFGHHANIDWLGTLRGAIQLSAKALQDDPDQLAAQLLGRLTHDRSQPQIERLLGEALTRHGGRWLCPMFPSLQAPGGPLLQVLQHEQPSAVAIAPDGSRAVSGSFDGTVKVWDLDNDRSVGPALDHGDCVTTVAITPDGRHVVSGSADGTVKIWQLDREQPSATVLHHADSLATVTISGDGQRLVCVSQGATSAQIWALETGAALEKVTFKGGAGSKLAAAEDARRIVFSAGADVLQVIEPVGHRKRQVLEKGGKVIAVAITQDGSCAVSLSYDGKLGVWDLEGNTKIRTLETEAVKVEVRKGGVIYRTGGGSPDVHGFAVAANARRAISGYTDGVIRIWDLDVAEQHTLQHGSEVVAAALTRDGERAVSGGKDGTLKVWNLQKLAQRDAKPSLAAVSTIAISLDGRRVVSGSQDGRLVLWDVADQWHGQTLQSHGFPVLGVTIAPDASRAICTSWEGSVTVWDLDRTRQTQILAELAEIRGVASITPDGRVALVGTPHGTLVAWELDRQAHEILRRDQWIIATALTPDGQRAISVPASSDGRLEFWNLSRRRKRKVLRHGSSVSAVAVTADGRWALSGSDSDYTVKVWDLNDGEETLVLAHPAPVTAVAVTSDRRWALSGTADAVVTLWDLASGKTTATFKADSGVSACAIAATPTVTIAVGDAGGAVHVLQLK